MYLRADRAVWTCEHALCGRKRSAPQSAFPYSAEAVPCCPRLFCSCGGPARGLGHRSGRAGGWGGGHSHAGPSGGVLPVRWAQLQQNEPRWRPCDFKFPSASGWPADVAPTAPLPQRSWATGWGGGTTAAASPARRWRRRSTRRGHATPTSTASTPTATHPTQASGTDRLPEAARAWPAVFLLNCLAQGAFARMPSSQSLRRYGLVLLCMATSPSPQPPRRCCASWASSERGCCARRCARTAGCSTSWRSGCCGTSGGGCGRRASPRKPASEPDHACSGPFRSR